MKIRWTYHIEKSKLSGEVVETQNYNTEELAHDAFDKQTSQYNPNSGCRNIKYPYTEYYNGGILGELSVVARKWFDKTNYEEFKRRSLYIIS